MFCGNQVRGCIEVEMYSIASKYVTLLGGCMSEVTLLITKSGIVKLDGKELELAEVKHLTKGVEITLNPLMLIDPYYLTVPKQFEKLHTELLSLVKTQTVLDNLYTHLLSADSIRKKYFVEHDVIPYYIVPYVHNALVMHKACVNYMGMLRKTEIFTRFLMYRADAIVEETGGESVPYNVKNIEQISAEEEKASRKYRLPPMDELKAMNYEMLTMEMAKAEEMMAKPKYIKILKTLRTEKSATKIRKTEKQVMDEAIREERDVQDGEHETVSTTRLAKHQKRKAEQQRKDEERFEKKSKGAAIKQIKPNEEYIG